MAYCSSSKARMKRNILKRPSLSGRVCSVVRVPVPASWSLLQAGWHAKSLRRSIAPQTVLPRGRDIHCFAGTSGGSEEKSMWSVSPVLAAASGRLPGKDCKEQGKLRRLPPCKIFPAASHRSFLHRSLYSSKFYKWLREPNLNSGRAATDSTTKLQRRLKSIFCILCVLSLASALQKLHPLSLGVPPVSRSDFCLAGKSTYCV